MHLDFVSLVLINIQVTIPGWKKKKNISSDLKEAITVTHQSKSGYRTIKKKKRRSTFYSEKIIDLTVTESAMNYTPKYSGVKCEAVYLIGNA